MSDTVPHPIPYQGSKRRLAAEILKCFPRKVDTLLEPFAGSAAVSLAALNVRRVERIHLGDSLTPLMVLWSEILNRPQRLIAEYTSLWEAQRSDPRAFYQEIRARFNRVGQPEDLLYLLARCVKSAVRFNGAGEFNQSADHRRLGARPEAMARRIMGAHHLMVGRTCLTPGDYRELVMEAKTSDCIYLDPPYEGTSGKKDQRYFQQFNRTDFVECLEGLLERGIAFIVSLDGRTGAKDHGTYLPTYLGLTRLELDAGRSTQATLNGRNDRTVESLYLSPQLGPFSR